MLAMRNQEQIEVIDSLKKKNQDYYRLKREQLARIRRICLFDREKSR